MNFKIPSADEFIEKLNKLDEKTFDLIYEKLIDDVEADNSDRNKQDNDWKKVNNDMWRNFRWLGTLWWERLLS